MSEIEVAEMESPERNEVSGFLRRENGEKVRFSPDEWAAIKLFLTAKLFDENMRLTDYAHELQNVIKEVRMELTTTRAELDLETAQRAEESLSWLDTRWGL